MLRVFMIFALRTTFNNQIHETQSIVYLQYIKIGIPFGMPKYFIDNRQIIRKLDTSNTYHEYVGRDS